MRPAIPETRPRRRSDLVLLANLLAEEWGVSIGPDDAVRVGHPELGSLENLVHELAHAALLGMAPGPNLADAVSRALGTFPEPVRVLHEAAALVVEFRALEGLGLASDDWVGFGELADAGEMQGVSSALVEACLDLVVDDEVAAVYAALRVDTASYRAEDLGGLANSSYR
jgi:hypothetical protein